MLPPVIAISGFSGAGKTTLIVHLIRTLSARGLSVGVIKHDAHGLTFDTPGKDSYRFREAGASRVEAFDSRWWFQVAPSPAKDAGPWLPRSFRQDLDILLVEGGKSLDLDRVWLRAPGGDGPAEGVSGVLLDLERGSETPARVEELILRWLVERWAAQPVAVILLYPARDPVQHGDGVERALAFARDVIVAGPAPGHVADDRTIVLPSVPGSLGPLGCLLSATRWSPGHSFIVVRGGVEVPPASRLEALWNGRRPGTWAIIQDGICVVEPQAAHLLEQASCGDETDPLTVLARHDRTLILDRPG